METIKHSAPTTTTIMVTSFALLVYMLTDQWINQINHHLSIPGYEQFPSDQYTDGTGGGDGDYDIVTDVGNGVAIQV